MSLISNATGLEKYAPPSCEELNMPQFNMTEMSTAGLQIYNSLQFRVKEVPRYVEGESEGMQKVRKIWTSSLEEMWEEGFFEAAHEAKMKYGKEWRAMIDIVRGHEDIPAKYFPGKYMVIKKLIKSIHDYHAFEYDKEGNEREGWLLKCATFRIDCLLTDDEEKQKKIREVIRVAAIVLWSASAFFFCVVTAL